MTWHLKNQTLEEHLNAISEGDFTKQLNNYYPIIEGEGVYISFGEHLYGGGYDSKNGKKNYQAYFPYWALEFIPDYDPSKWNEFPKVTPPYDVMMRADFTGGKNGYKAFYKHFEEGDCWCHADGTVMPKTYSDAIERFRPWDD